MDDAILISDRPEDLPPDIARLIGESGFELRWIDDPDAAHAFTGGPESLVLMSAELIDRKPESGRGLVDDCRHRHVPCLVFSATESESKATRDDIRCGRFVRRLHDVDEWHEKITLHRQICLQADELTMMQRRLHSRTEEEEDDLRSAALIQRSLLPRKIPDIGGFRFAWKFEPFEKVGGDLFNVLQIDEETIMAFLLDVSGHGISSAMVTVSVNQSLSLHTGQLVKRLLPEPPYYRLLTPAEVMGELSTEYPFERFDKFFTIAYLLINIHTGELRYSCAGHPPPLVVRSSGEIEWLRAGGGLIGLADTGPYEEGSCGLERGDRVFLYSDGLPDYSDYSGEHFGSRRLVDVLARDRSSLADICGSVIREMKGFGDNRPLQDDVTLLGIEYTGR